MCFDWVGVREVRAHVFLGPGPSPRKVEILGPDPARAREYLKFWARARPGPGRA